MDFLVGFLLGKNHLTPCLVNCWSLDGPFSQQTRTHINIINLRAFRAQDNTPIASTPATRDGKKRPRIERKTIEKYLYAAHSLLPCR